MNNRMYIDGEWIGAQRFERMDVRNPATGRRIGDIPIGGALEAKMAIEAAARAFRDWSRRTAAERGAYLMRLHRLMLEHEEDLAATITLEMGKPLKEARGEVKYAASFLEWYAEEGKRVYGEMVPSSHPDKRIMVLQQPVGVVGAITPWNFPAAMLTRKLAPALAAGCTIAIKPSEWTSFTAIKLMELVEKAEFPAGAVNLVLGDAAAIGGEFMSNDKMKKISFTGSTRVGKLLMEQAAGQVKKLSLELGGHAPMIVLDDADLGLAVREIIASKFRNAGQACICGNRVYVQHGVYDEFIALFAEETRKLKVGDGFDIGTDIGPLINRAAREKVERQVKDAVAKGASVVTGGDGWGGEDSCFYLPTILTHADESMQVMREETFGPVAPVRKFYSDEEAVRLANDTPYGLAAYVFSRSLSRGMRMVERLEYGIVGWNDGLPSTAQAPFGGMKESGIGREGGHQGISCYLETKYVSIGI
ncbi:NAD-dependent succinate-semialdehyde dehydrogenase [Paenibacillaceae bacterium WGS1546]|uniref:NAD-dependent succinate-semialdehyde dehydrogenase n=1 Tax=Cohnella sp. WGS1546 TaxID=3366810 RepID=UPI00372D1273